MGQIKLLDCTLRDGGLGLEDALKNKIADDKFTAEEREQLAYHLNRAGLDIIELGSIDITEDDRRGYAIYQNVEAVSAVIPKDRDRSRLYVGLFRGPDTPMEDIPDWNPDLVDGLRVIIRYSELQKSLDFCAGLAAKGYKVFVQPMLTMRYTEEELDLIIDQANKMGAYALYFVDSYGYMQTEDVMRFFRKYDQGLHPSICIGFHAHNNMNLAYANALSFIGVETERTLIADACAIGMGQGAGNLQTELITSYLNTARGGHYDFEEVLEVCEIVDRHLSNALWGYSVTRLLPALYRTAYKYALCYRSQYGLSFVEINRILQEMPDPLRHRYTPEDAKQAMRVIAKN